MNIEKEIVIRVKTTDGKQLNVGDMVVFVSKGKTCIATYMGIGKKGALAFCGVKLGDVKTRFAVMPSSISKIYKCKLDVLTAEEWSV